MQKFLRPHHPQTQTNPSYGGEKFDYSFTCEWNCNEIKLDTEYSYSTTHRIVKSVFSVIQNSCFLFLKFNHVNNFFWENKNTVATSATSFDTISHQRATNIDSICVYMLQFWITFIFDTKLFFLVSHFFRKVYLPFFVSTYVFYFMLFRLLFSELSLWKKNPLFIRPSVDSVYLIFTELRKRSRLFTKMYRILTIKGFKFKISYPRLHSSLQEHRDLIKYAYNLR